MNQTKVNLNLEQKSVFIGIGKNTSLTLTKDKVKIEYISGGQPSPFELAFGVELGPNPHSKLVSEPILDPLKGSPTILSIHQTQKCWT